MAAEDKEKVFQRGFGRNTGLGRFLVREGLSTTGITLRENGTEGEAGSGWPYLPGRTGTAGRAKRSGPA
jgi:hypothetical protein